MGNKLGNVETEGLKSPRQIRKETSGFSRVLVPSEGLAEACNALAESSGRKKYVTPREASGLDPGWSRELFLELKENRSWREASYLKDAAESCLRTTGGLEGLEELDIDNERIQEVREAAREILGNALDPEFPGEVAVAGKEMMDGFQRSVLPDERQSVELFEGTVELEEFRIFSSPGAVASTVAANIRELGSSQVAVVASEDSVYRSAVESRLEASSIPYYTRRSVSRDEDLRTFVALLRAGTSSGSLSLQSVKPVLDQLGISYPESKTRAKIDSLDSLEGFRELLSVLPSLTFGDALDRFEELGGRTEIGPVLENLGIADVAVSEENLSRLRYYLESVETGTVDEDGVLVTGSGNAGYVNRSVVFFLGMDDQWNPDIEDWPWIEPEDEIRRSVERMKATVQSGKRQLYMVRDVEMNRDIQPCIQLQEMIEGLEKFTAAAHTEYTQPETQGDGGFQRSPVEVSKGNEVDTATLSQSQLNDLALSPKVYYFSRLVSDADDLAMEKGTLFHDFAEFYVSHPNFVEEKGIEEFAEFMMKELDQYMDQLERRGLATEVRKGLENLEKFLDPEGGQQIPFERDGERGRNSFAEEYGREIRSENTEIGFRDPELGLNGKIDLLQDNRVVDFKSGRSRSPFKAFRKSHPDLYTEERFPDFQPLLYTAFLTRHVEGRLKFSYFYFLDSLGDSVLGEREEDEDVVDISFVPQNFEEYARTNEFFRKVIGDVAESNDRRKTLEKIGQHRFADFIEEHGFPEVYSKQEIEETEFFKELQSFGREKVGDYKYVSNGLESAAKKMVELRTSSFYREDVRKFRGFVEEKREELERYLEDGFPVGERKIGELPNRDLILG